MQNVGFTESNFSRSLNYSISKVMVLSFFIDNSLERLPYQEATHSRSHIIGIGSAKKVKQRMPYSSLIALIILGGTRLVVVVPVTQ